jgi:hypothetical protein
MEQEGAEPASLNKLRATLHSVFAQAQKAELWRGPSSRRQAQRRSLRRG